MAATSLSQHRYFLQQTETDSLLSFQCSFCPSRCSTQNRLKAHMSLHHGDQMPFRCDICGRGYLSRPGLIHHHQSSHEGKTLTCPVCDCKKSKRNNLKQHLRSVHKSDQCMQCMEVIPLEDFDSHMQAHLQHDMI